MPDRQTGEGGSVVRSPELVALLVFLCPRPGQADANVITIMLNPHTLATVQGPPGAHRVTLTHSSAAVLEQLCLKLPQYVNMWSYFVSLKHSQSFFSFSVNSLSALSLPLLSLPPPPSLSPGMGTGGVGEVEVELGSGDAERLH